MASDLLSIGYGGTLRAWHPTPPPPGFFKKLKQWVWTYVYTNLDENARTGYYLFKGLAELRKNSPEVAAKVRIQLWGMIAEGNAVQAKEFGVDDLVEISGHMPKADSVKKLQACDVLFLPLEGRLGSQENFYVPAKVFDYMKLEKPILCMGQEGAATTQILKPSGLGEIVDPYDSQAVAASLEKLVRSKDQLGEQYKADRAYVEDNFSFKVQTGKLAAVMKELLSKGG